MLLALIVFAAMGVMDTFAALKIDVLDRHDMTAWKRRILAGACEMGNDYGGIFSYGLGGASLLHYGVSVTTAVILIALGCASLGGTALGDWVNERLVNSHGARST